MKRYSQAIDQNGMPIPSGIPQSDSISTMVFTAAGVKTQGIPAGANLVLIEKAGGADIFVWIGGTASIPSADNDFSVTGVSSPEANALVRWLSGASSISVAATSACTLTLAYYS
jgi:hypothetical protein